ncbi:woronin body major protein [Magnaporthiopsis poae ATCC 64411]|uniref:Woronin body major protein n=1 Tax=Magnaporthiopsis poae (strain ATCC 64411 / 73-15) TaxID=644358 RepID=A0A0C4DR79_MAGP6|nr:woronin body major protein [Magnaporthiopsis poae ATCC 64411]
MAPIILAAYKEETKPAVTATTTTHEEVELRLPEAGREGRHSSSVSAVASLPPRREQEYYEEEVRYTREEEHHHRPGTHHHLLEERRPQQSSYSEKFVDVEYHHDHHDHHHHHHDHRPARSEHRSEHRAETVVSAIDTIERGYRARAQPNYKEPSEYTVDSPRSHTGPAYKETVEVEEYALVPAKKQNSHKHRPVYREEIEIEENESVASSQSSRKSDKMGYYDDSGRHHSIRDDIHKGLHKAADRLIHPHGHDHHDHHVANDNAVARRSPKPNKAGANVVTIPCHHIRMGDILILQGRPCQVIRISTSPATGQHRYLGVDLFTKQLHEESSNITNPEPSVVIQSMRGPVFRQYRVLDLQDGLVTCMTENGDVRPGIPVMEQSNLWQRLTEHFESGRGSVRVLVANDGPRELIVDVKVMHGSRL